MEQCICLHTALWSIVPYYPNIPPPLWGVGWNPLLSIWDQRPARTGHVGMSFLQDIPHLDATMAAFRVHLGSTTGNRQA
jgi:hypothetical protein